MKTYIAGTIMALLAILLLLWPAATTHAEGESIKVVSASVTSEFPDGIRFAVEASGENEITTIAVRIKVGQLQRGAYNYLDFQPGLHVDSEFFWRTDTSGRFIPPGTGITYYFEIEDSEGGTLETEPALFIYHDARFTWEEVSDGPIAVAYHGPVKVRAEKILAAVRQTLNIMGPVLDADTTIPIRVTMYNNIKEMLDALPPGSATVRRELNTEGQAFSPLGTLVVNSGGRLAEGIASHEVTHILTFRAGSSIFGGIPRWLDEGLAEYGNLTPGFSYDIALEFALETGRLLPITSMTLPPGDPEDAIIFYGEARSIVRFMVAGFGPERMAALLALLKTGINMDQALMAVYRTDRLGLENAWRESIRAPAYNPPDIGSLLPTPIAMPTVLAYSLTPQAQSAAVAGTMPTATPEPEPVALLTDQEGEPEPEARADEEVSGSGCNAPRDGRPRAMDISGLVLVAGLAGLAVRRRRGS